MKASQMLMLCKGCRGTGTVPAGHREASENCSGEVLVDRVMSYHLMCGGSGVKLAVRKES